MQKETTYTFSKEETIAMLQESLVARGIKPSELRINIGEDPTWDGPWTCLVLMGMSVTVKENI